MSTTLTANPAPTPIRGTRLVTFDVADLARELTEALPPQPRPLVEELHPACCVVCTPTRGDEGREADAAVFVQMLADAVAVEAADPPVEFEDPQLTPGQKRVFDGERARLFRMLDARTPAKDAAVLELLDDMAGQAPAVDQVIAAEAERRLETAAARPTLALALASNRRTP